MTAHRRFAAFVSSLTTQAQVDEAIRLRCRNDLALFGALIFPERLPLPYNAFHHVTLSRPKTPWRARKQPQRLADAAPRGNAKSTLESYISLIHDAVYGLEAFVGLISTTYDLSEDLVSDLHAALTSPDAHPDLHRIYGPIKVTGPRTDFVVRCPGGAVAGTRFAAFSFGGSIRGVKHQGIRPTKIVIDDGEHPDKVRSPLQREKTWDYLTKDVLKCGGKYTIYRVIGTVLHPDSLLNRVIGHAAGTHGLGWRGTRWQSVLSWPTRADLWAECRELWADLTDPDREATARSFFERHRAAMEEGASVLWPQHEDIYDLHVMLWTDGAASFNSEKQNEATDPDRQVFFPEAWKRCRWDGEYLTTSKGRRIHHAALTFAVWLDPRASAEMEKNDYAALAIAARDKYGYCYLLSCDMRRDKPAEQLARIWSAFEVHGPRAAYGYEDNGFAVVMGTLFDDMRRERMARGRSGACALTGHNSSTNKQDRITSLAPRLDVGHIEVADDFPQSVIEQFRQIPTGSHDDGPDACERALWLLDGGGAASAELSARIGGGR